MATLAFPLENRLWQMRLQAAARRLNRKLRGFDVAQLTTAERQKLVRVLRRSRKRVDQMLSVVEKR